ncbi:branched-chain amino acid transport system substrate-binding protein [Bradyrhizobium sp. AZCC 1577]|uniref:ABC transporter substrate-binding protein n=1 Tax=Bradyrhizobium sp. AZCC 1577 TaxID=3117019 RepID=UPI00303C4EDD
MNAMWKSLRLTFSTAAAALLMAQASYAQQPIKIGAILSVTGPASFLGEPQKRTIEMLAQQVNAGGGIAGRKIELVVYDDGGDANAARTFASRLIDQDKVVAMVGGSTTGTTMAMLPAFEEAEIPFMSMAGALQVVQPVKKWVFKTPQTDTMACEKIFEDVKARGLSSIAVVFGTDGFGRSMRDQCVAVAPKYGVNIVHEESFGPKDSDMTPQLTNVRGKKEVQAIVVPGIGQTPAILARNYKQLGMRLPLYVSHGVASKEFIDLSAGGAEGARLPVPALLVGSNLAAEDAQRAPVLAYTQAYEKAANQPVSAFGGFMHDGFQMVVEAIKRSVSTEPAKIRDALEATKGFVGVNGIYSMTAKDHMGLDLTGFRMVEIKSGNWSPIASGK